MQKKSQGRFTPNVKFSIMGEKRDLLSSIGIPIMSNYIRTAFNGDIVDLCDCMTTFEKWQDAKEVSIYEAIPELIPDGMRYNKELDKLVPNIIENEKVKKVITDEKFYITDIPKDMEKRKELLSFVGEFDNSEDRINISFDLTSLVYLDKHCDYVFRAKNEHKIENYHTVITYDDLLSNYLPKNTKIEILQFADLGKSIDNVSKSATNTLINEQLKFAKSLGADINEIPGDFLNKDEKINLRENGFFKADLDKTDFTLVCPYAYEDLAKQLTIGAKKYARDNWQKGDILTYIAALERHINDVKKALIKNDDKALIDDTGINQGGALMFNSMAIHYFIRKILSGDENVK